MGVSGCGKSSLARALAERLGYEFVEGDDFHPAANIEKMRRAIPLEDRDRWPWLEALGAKLCAPHPVIMTCSALRKSYRDFLRDKAGRSLIFIALTGPRALLAQRLHARQGHYMPAGLLESQLSAFEDPSGEDHVLMLSIEKSLQELADEAFDFIMKYGEDNHVTS